MNQEDYIKSRVQDQIEWYDKKSTQYKKHASRLTLAIFICTLIIPFVAGIDFCYCVSEYKTLILGVLGLTATLLTGILEQKKFKELWVSYRHTCEQLKREKFLYETQSDKYCDEPTKFNVFVENIESILSKEHSNWNKNIVNNKSQEKK